VGADRLLVGTVEWDATNLGAGHLAQTTEAPFVVGEPDGSESDRLRRLVMQQFTPDRVRGMHRRIGELGDGLLEPMPAVLSSTSSPTWPIRCPSP